MGCILHTSAPPPFFVTGREGIGGEKYSERVRRPQRAQMIGVGTLRACSGTSIPSWLRQARWLIEEASSGQLLHHVDQLTATSSTAAYGSSRQLATTASSTVGSLQRSDVGNVVHSSSGFSISRSSRQQLRARAERALGRVCALSGCTGKEYSLVTPRLRCLRAPIGGARRHPTCQTWSSSFVARLHPGRRLHLSTVTSTSLLHPSVGRPIHKITIQG